MHGTAASAAGIDGRRQSDPRVTRQRAARAAGGNLLLFIAFNFTISGDLPRLGYLTFLDAILVCTFMITGLVLAFNVYLRWLEVGERVAFARTLDRYTLGIYPLGYLVTFAAVAWIYLG